VNYSQPNGLPLSECVTRDELFEYNQKNGLSNYIDPFTQLFCVRFNNAPEMGTYYLENTDLTEEMIDDLLSNRQKQGFGATIFG